MWWWWLSSVVVLLLLEGSPLGTRCRSIPNDLHQTHELHSRPQESSTRGLCRHRWWCTRCVPVGRKSAIRVLTCQIKCSMLESTTSMKVKGKTQLPQEEPEHSHDKIEDGAGTIICVQTSLSPGIPIGMSLSVTVCTGQYWSVLPGAWENV